MDGMFLGDPIIDLVHARCESGFRAARERLALLVERSMLIAEVPVERLLGAVKEELADINAVAVAEVARLAVRDPAAREFHVRALAALDAGTCVFPRADVERLLGDLPAEHRALRERLEAACRRHRDLQRRVEAMLHPLTGAELDGLDPVRDAGLIQHSVGWSFRSERVFFGALEEMRPLMAAPANLFFFASGEFALRTQKRFIDTVLLFDNVSEWGAESRRGREAMARVNAIHGRYNIPNDAFRWVLLNLVFVPVTWNERLGWRRFTDVERLGWFHHYISLGRGMHVQGLSDDYDEMHEWWRQASAASAGFSEITRSSFEKLTAQLLEHLPDELRATWLETLLAGMDDDFRSACGYPPTPPALFHAVRETLHVLGQLGSQLPPAPWIRSLQSYAVYPHGARVDELGVYRRGYAMPRPAWDKAPAETPPPESHGRNGGYAQGMQPLSRVEQVLEVPLPTLGWDEVRRHTSPDDAWLVLDGYVIDVSAFLSMHPGGRKVLLAQAGRDATEVFRRMGHSEAARILATNFRIGRIAAEVVAAHG